MIKKTHRTLLMFFVSTAFFCGRVSGLEIPRRSDDFVESIGVNAHFDEVSSLVYNEAIVGQSGIRHFRSNVAPFGTETLNSRLTDLYAHFGTRTNISCDTTAWSVLQYRDLMKNPMFDSIEGLNEPDGVGPRSYGNQVDNWITQTYPATLAFQRDLFAAMAADPTTAGKEVLSPAMANPSNSVYLRTVAADYISVHSYPAQQMPTGNFLESFTIPAAKAMGTGASVSMPLISTETGYLSGSAYNDISLQAAAKYIPRIYAEYFRLGIVRTFLFEMNDVPGVYNYGIVDANFSPKSAYGTLKTLIGLLGESTWNSQQKAWTRPNSFNPGPTDLTITGGSATLHHILLQKSTGELNLLLWQELPSFDLVSRRDIANPSTAVTVSFGNPIATAAVYELDSLVPKLSSSNQLSLPLNITDAITIVKVTLGSPPPVVVINNQPIVSMLASAPRASVANGQQGQVVVSRTGNTSTDLKVYYSLSGNAASGSDYLSLPGSVTIPAGLSQTTVVVYPGSSTTLGQRNLRFSLNPDPTYAVANANSAAIYFGSNRSVVADFESGISGWTGNGLWSNTSLDATNADTGNGCLKITLGVDPANRWKSNFQMNFATAQDWSQVSTLELRFKESPSNPLSDTGKAIYFSWINNGSGVGGGYGVGKIPLSHSSTYSTVSIDLKDFPRDRVSALYFYVDGAFIDPGAHSLYFDNLTAISATATVLDDFEQSGTAYWSAGHQSSVSTESGVVDSGTQSLKWTFSATSTQRWDNYVMIEFPTSVDLSQYSKLSLRFKEDANNPNSDIGKTVFFDWSNSASRPNGSAGVTSFTLQPSGGYHTVELNLANFQRNHVDYLFFYVDGFSVSPGRHYWYLDNLIAY